MKRAKADPTELRVIACVADGMTDAQIDTAMGWTKRATEDVLRRLRRKMNATNRAHLVHLAWREGWIK